MTLFVIDVKLAQNRISGTFTLILTSFSFNPKTIKLFSLEITNYKNLFNNSLIYYILLFFYSIILIFFLRLYPILDSWRSLVCFCSLLAVIIQLSCFLSFPWAYILHVKNVFHVVLWRIYCINELLMIWHHSSLYTLPY